MVEFRNGIEAHSFCVRFIGGKASNCSLLNLLRGAGHKISLPAGCFSVNTMGLVKALPGLKTPGSPKESDLFKSTRQSAALF